MLTPRNDLSLACRIGDKKKNTRKDSKTPLEFFLGYCNKIRKIAKRKKMVFYFYFVPSLKQL